MASSNAMVPQMVLPTVPTGRDRARWLTMLGAGVALGMMILGVWALIASRQDAWSHAQQNAGNLLLTLDRDIGRNISVLDLSLIGLMEALEVPGIADVNPVIRQHALFDRSSSAENLGSMLVLDTYGGIVADSTSTVVRQQTFEDRSYFRVHRDNPKVGLYVSRPFESRIANGDLRIAISRRLDTASGDFAGVVVATLRLTYFQQLFERLDIGKNGAINLVRTDGRVLFRHPFRRQDIDLSLANSLNFSRFNGVKSGQYVAVAAIDGIERLYTFRQIGNLPITLFVSLSTEEILAPWRQKAIVIGSVMLVLCTSAVASSLLFRREMLKRATSERALAAANQQLSIQASTDGLTGLTNRRAFDAEFDRAFRAAIRTGTPIAALMIDADHFKRFNDTYGHGAGDAVLRAVAGCMAAHVRRASDLLARYGGEEFVALLPDTDLNSAVALGDRIRQSVRDLNIPHAHGASGHVSVSIGVGATIPMIGDRPDTLLRSADRGLYVAKAEGRDCVRYAEQPHPPDLAAAIASATARAPQSETHPA